MKTERFSIPRRARGLSLVEIMVSLSIGIIVLGAVLYTYIGGRSTYRLNTEMSRLQETGRVVMNMLERDLRTSAYAGCAGISALNMPVGVAPDTWREDIRTGVHVTPRSGTVVSPAFGAYLLRTVAPSFNAGIKEFAADRMSLTLYGGVAAQVGDYVMVSDCSSGDIQRIGDVALDADGNTLLMLDNAISSTFLSDRSRAFVLSVYDGKLGVSYDIKNGESPSPEGETIGALTRNGIEVAEGVEAFRVCLGTGNAYDAGYGEGVVSKIARAEVFDSDPAAREKVITVQADLLLASPSANVLEQEEEQTFTLCGDDSPTITTNDRRARKLFSTTVSLRNKLR
jgi:type IV pilus assembly protein PilW